MPARPAAPFPFEALAEGVASVAADGTFAPQNAAMRALLAAWSPDRDTLARVLGGEAVCVAADGAEHELRVAEAGGVRWLVARPCDDADAAGAHLAAARVRQLGKLAGSIVHDLNNVLGSAMGLASLLVPTAADPADVRLLEEMQRGVQRGATMARELARMLKTGPRQRQRIAVDELVGGVVVLVTRSASTRGVELATAAEEGLPPIRVIAAEASQALLHGLVAVLDTTPRRIVVTTAAVRHAVVGGRERACVRVRVAGEQCAQAIGEGDSSPEGWQTVAALALRRAGGELVVDRSAAACTIDYVWPAATAS